MIDTVPCPECGERSIPVGVATCNSCGPQAEPAAGNGIYYRFYTPEDVEKLKSEARWAGAIAMRKAIIAALHRPLRNGIIDTIESLPVPE